MHVAPLPLRIFRALQALPRLLRSPDATAQAIELIQGLDPKRARRGVARVARSEHGRLLLRERPSLLALLSAREELAALPDGSFGRAYLQHMDRYALDPFVLVRLQRELDATWSTRDESERWWIERNALIHDLWHVLTGCGSDPFGEARLLPFSFAQQGGLSNALFTTLVAVRGGRQAGRRWFAMLWHSWRCGLRAHDLSSVRYEMLLAEPLDTVRKALGVIPFGASPAF